MPTRSRFNSAISAIALTAALGACAAPGGNRTASASDYRNKSVDIGVATRALAALNAGDFASAVGLAERAVAQNPRDAGFRTLLGNAYFGAGRFTSAEQAFRDSLALYPTQGKVMLKLALVEIALGKPADALELIDYARDLLDPADYGLAMALAGRPADAVAVLRGVAGGAGADARVRQNLALAYALAGDWVNARVVAAQDVAGNELDARIQQWMSFAGAGARPANRIAALVGVTPSAYDPGQPVKLALVAPAPKAETAVAATEPEATPLAPPAPAPAPAPVAVAAPAPAPAAAELVTYAPPPPPPPRAPAKPVVVAASAPVENAPETGSITVKLPKAQAIAAAAPAFAAEPAEEAPLGDAQFPYVQVKPRPAKAKLVAASAKPKPKPKPAVKAKAAAAPTKRAPLVKAAAKLGKANVVVQLGAFGTSDRVAKAWSAASRKYSALANYAPVSATVSGPKGKFHRLSVRGFASQAEAGKLCGSIRKAGGSCFVRTLAGDRPVQIAAR